MNHTVRLTARDVKRQGRLQETPGTTGYLIYIDVDCQRPLETRETRGYYRDDWRLALQLCGLLETSIDK